MTQHANTGGHVDAIGKAIDDVIDQISTTSTIGTLSAEDQAWANYLATHRELQRVEDTLDVAYACMEAVSIGFVDGTYDPAQTVYLGRQLLDWEARLQAEQTLLRQMHQRHYNRWLNYICA